MDGRIWSDVVVGNVCGHDCGEVGAESCNLLVDVSEECVGGPSSHELDGVARDLVEIECHCTASTQ